MSPTVPGISVWSDRACLPLRPAQTCWPLVTVASLIAAVQSDSMVLAGIAGFNNLNPSEWRYNQSDTGTPADLPNADTVHLTSGSGQARSIFFNAPQDISEFTAEFTFQALNNCCLSSGRGVTFTIQNDPRGPTALGGTLGYTGIANSAAISLDLRDNNSGFVTGGVIGSGAQPVSPVNLLSGHLIEVSLNYDGFYLSETLVDTVTSATFSRQNIIVGDLSSRVGGDTAYVGFTAGASSSVDQYISNFRYSVPEPATVSMLVLGTVALWRQSRRRVSAVSRS